MRAVVQWLVLGSLLAVGVSGCSTETEAPTRSLTTTQVTALIRGVEEHNGFLHNAHQQLIVRCMRKAGYEYRPTTATDAVPDPFRGTKLDATSAARQGYGMRRTVEQPRRVEAQDRYQSTLAPAEAKRYATALDGTDDSAVTVDAAGASVSTNSNGCYAEATKAVWGDLSEWLRLTFTARNVLGEASRGVESDPALVDARKAWSACMSAAGFNYAGRRKVQDDFAARYTKPGADRDAIFTAEVTTAKADARCATQTSFERIQSEAQNRAANAAVSKYEPELAALRQRSTESVTRATSALASS